MRIAVLASGSGTILESILTSGVEVSLVVTDRPCRALAVAEEFGIGSLQIPRLSYGRDFDRGGYTSLVVDALSLAGIELVVMAGYGTVLGARIHESFSGRILNTHPSLLPAFPGWHAVEAALGFGVKVTGCTVHIATLEVDAGPILAQEAVPVFPSDDVPQLHERIKEVERLLYPATIAAFASHLESGSTQRFDLGYRVVREGKKSLVLRKYYDCKEF